VVEQTLADVGEFGLVDRLLELVGPGRPGEVGPGDDAAVVGLVGPVVATTDVLVEGLHFRLDWAEPLEVGAKAAAQSCADVAAMGGRTDALLVGFGGPPSTPVELALGLMRGLVDEAARAGARVVGGDVVRSESLLLSVTALGTLLGPHPVQRSGACPGDRVVVAGSLGASAAGLAVLMTSDPGLRKQHAGVVARHRRPVPDYDLAVALARAGASAMIDTSDGFAADAGHVARASGVGLVVDCAALPVAAGVAAAGHALGVDPLTWVLGGGEDHAFLATMPAGADLPDGVQVVGEVVEGSGVVDTAGRPLAGGHDHFGGGS
jgi:thiamine-monophosphate kinase